MAITVRITGVLKVLYLTTVDSSICGGKNFYANFVEEIIGARGDKEHL